MTRNQRRLHPVIWVCVAIAGVVLVLLGLSVPSTQSHSDSVPASGESP